MMIGFSDWISLYKDGSAFGLICLCCTIAAHAWCTGSEVTTKFPDSKPLLNLPYIIKNRSQTLCKYGKRKQNHTTQQRTGGLYVKIEAQKSKDNHKNQLEKNKINKNSINGFTYWLWMVIFKLSRICLGRQQNGHTHTHIYEIYIDSELIYHYLLN
jgi:hypothetical protein